MLAGFILCVFTRTIHASTVRFFYNLGCLDVFNGLRKDAHYLGALLSSGKTIPICCTCRLGKKCSYYFFSEVLVMLCATFFSEYEYSTVMVFAPGFYCELVGAHCFLIVQNKDWRGLQK